VLFRSLGDGTTTNRASPVYTSGVDGTGRLTDVISVAAGFNHTSALTPNGVYSWGVSTAGQMGAGDFASSAYPILGPHFQAVRVSFAGVYGTELTVSDGDWTVLTPESTAGVAAVQAVAKLFAGTVAADVPELALTVGNFTFNAPTPTPTPTPTPAEATGNLAATGFDIAPAFTIATLSVFGGLALVLSRVLRSQRAQP
jgi:hypothetical protein